MRIQPISPLMLSALVKIFFLQSSILSTNLWRHQLDLVGRDTIPALIRFPVFCDFCPPPPPPAPRLLPLKMSLAVLFMDAFLSA